MKNKRNEINNTKIQKTNILFLIINSLNFNIYVVFFKKKVYSIISQKYAIHNSVHKSFSKIMETSIS